MGHCDALSSSSSIDTICAPMQGFRLLNMTRAVSCKLPASELQDAATLANLVRTLGLTRHGRGQIYGSERIHMLPGSTVMQRSPSCAAAGAKCQSGLGQVPAQIGAAVVALEQLRVRTMLEVGTAAGWTAAFVAAVLRRFVRRGGDWQSLTLDTSRICEPNAPTACSRRWVTASLSSLQQRGAPPLHARASGAACGR